MIIKSTLQWLSIAILLFVGRSISFAAPEEWNTGNMRIKYEYQHFILKNAEQYAFISETEKNNSSEEVNNTNFCFENPDKNQVLREKKWQINTEEIKKFLSQKIAPQIEQEVSHVKISKDENGKIQFEGYGLDGIAIDYETSANLIAYAIKNGISQVTLAVKKTPAQVIVEDEELKEMGITELVAVGRSDFYPSSRKRIQNIMAGASQFNGFLVKPGEEFSFNTQLGLVDKSTGYAEEYVILGPQVVKEYGGGLCQVSSTAYRGVMLAGLPITERHEHSFAVSHYKPYGSDATIYQGVKDFRFKNDTDTALLIQTRRGGHRNSELFFHYYGTKTKRNVKIFGPVIKNRKNALPPKTTYSSALPIGHSKKVSNAVRGFDASFGRLVTENNQTEFDDQFLSHYQARGEWIIKGGTDPAISSSEISRPQFTEPLDQN